MEKEKRLIDANAMRDDWLENGENEYVYDTNAVLESIDAQPTVDAVEVVHGRWIDKTEWIGSFGQVRTECSICGTIYPHKPGSRGDGKGGKFCEECGARMDGAK